MKKWDRTKKLVLRRETLREITAQDSKQAVGGSILASNCLQSCYVACKTIAC